jgi:hypothetical protein
LIHGEDMHDRKIEEAAEVRSADASPMQNLRQAAGLSEKVWDVQDLF